MLKKWVALATAATMLAAMAAPGQSAIMAPINRLPTDPPRIPLTRSVPVELPTQTPDGLVKALYARKSPFLGKVSGYRKGFMPDMARAMAQDAQPGEDRIIDFDWRFGAPKKRVRRLKFTTLIRDETATVTARFRVRRKQREIRIQLFRRNSGWRIHDVGYSGAHAWSLRSCLHMRGALMARSCVKPPRDPASMKPDMMVIPPKPPISPKTMAPPVAPAPRTTPQR